MTPDYYAPPPGSATGVADYAESLRMALAPHGRLPVPLYHVGNNRLHVEIYRRALERPGVVVLHDAVLHHFLLGTLAHEKYVSEFVHNYGEWRRHLAEELWAGRSSSAVDLRYFEFPLLRRIAERSLAVIVHNPRAAAIARAHGAANPHLVPHFVEPEGLRDSAAGPAFRQRHGIPQAVTLFGIFGYLREAKRVLPSLNVFRRLHAVRPDTALLLAGDPVSADLARLLGTLAEAAIHRVGYLSPAEFADASAAIDCCINLRYPGAGETSGIAVRMMAAGKPVILSEGEQNADIPATACLRVAPGAAEADELFEQMVLVCQFPRIAKDIGNQARRHIREHHSLERIAQSYWKILCAAARIEH